MAVSLELASSFIKEARELVATGSRSATKETAIRHDITGRNGFTDSCPSAVRIAAARSTPNDGQVNGTQSHVCTTFFFKSLKNAASSTTTPRAVLNRAAARPRTSGTAIDKPLNKRHNQPSIM